MEETRKEKRARNHRQTLIWLLSLLAALAAGIVIGLMIAPVRTAPEGGSANEPTNMPSDAPTSLPGDETTSLPGDDTISLPNDEPTSLPGDDTTSLPNDEPTNEPTGVPTASEQTGVAETAVPQTAPANPMNQPESQSANSKEGYKRLLHADRIEEALSREALPLQGVRIGIDPGHQAKANSEKEPVAPGSSETKAKVSSGTQGVATRTPEYEVNLQVSLLLRDALEAQGAEVFMTRETHEVDISNVERATMMNELGVDLVLRIHCNGSNDSSVHGISLFVKPDGEGAEESYAACEALLPAMAEATGARAMGIYRRDTYSGLNWSTVPSILVEMGFMSNPEEDKLLGDPGYQQKLADGMTQGIADYIAGRTAQEG